jgi:hypothetical protein
MTRKIVPRNPHREVGRINCGWLLDHPVEHESHLERRFVIAALACSVVKDIVQQPRTLELVDGEEKYSYTPDYQVFLREGGSTYIEVKPKVFVAKYATKFKLASRILEHEGSVFRVITDEMIDGQGLAARASLLMSYGRLRYSDEEARECQRDLRRRFPDGASVNTITETGVPEALVWHLVTRHMCRVERDFEVQPSQRILTATIQGDNNDCFSSWFGA